MMNSEEDLDDYDEPSGDVTDDINVEDIKELLKNRQVIMLYKKYFIVNGDTIFNVSYSNMMKYFNCEVSLNYLVEQNEYIYSYSYKKNIITKRKVFMDNGKKSISFWKNDGFQEDLDKKHFTDNYIQYLKGYAVRNKRIEVFENL